MSEINDGGYAFPSPADHKAGWHAESGMTLRDYLAAKAAQAAVTGHFSHYGHTNYWAPKEIASYAYEIADALIAARSPSTNEGE